MTFQRFVNCVFGSIAFLACIGTFIVFLICGDKTQDYTLSRILRITIPLVLLIAVMIIGITKCLWNGRRSIVELRTEEEPNVGNNNGGYQWAELNHGQLPTYTESMDIWRLTTIPENDPPPKYEEIYQSHIKPEDEEMPIERTESCQESTDDCHTEEENSNSVENSQDIATVSQNAAQIESSTCEDVGCHAESEDGDRFSYTTHL